jgi:hypothetical protein
MCLRHSRLWLQHAQEWFIHAECDFDTHECELYTHEFNYKTMRLTLTRTNKNECKITKKFRIGWLAPWVWFWHSASYFNNHACDMKTHAWDFDTLRIKLLYYNILRPFEKLTPACVSDQHTARHYNRTILYVDSTRIREDSIYMRAGLTHMRVQNLYFNKIDIFSSWIIWNSSLLHKTEVM